nr:MAG TPA: putative transcriptional regulator [Caudoviricetes sp.]
MELHLIIKGIRKYMGLSQEDFANKLNMTRSNLSQMEIGRNTPSVALLNDIANIFHIDIRVIFQMINSNESVFPSLLPMLSLDDSSKEGKVKGKVNGKVSVDLPPESRNSKSTTLEKEEVKSSLFLPDSGKTTSTKIVVLPVPVKDDSEMVSIPVVDISVAAGSGFYNPDHQSEIDCIRMPRTMIKGSQPHLCVRIKGESMVPTLQDGGFLIIRLLDPSEWQDINDGHIYVVSEKEGRAFVKRLKNRLSEHGFIVCMSDSADVQRYPNFNLMDYEINTIWHAEWYISAKMPNIHATYYNKVGELENKYDDVIDQLQQLTREVRALAKQ